MGSLDYKVINNFLEKEHFVNLKNFLCSSDFNWYFNKHQTHYQEDGMFFSHTFFIDNKYNSPYYEKLIIPILDKLRCNALVRARANLFLKKENSYMSSWHVDTEFNCTTAILYINTNNGCTLLDEKDKIKINCIENNMLIFNSQIKHTAVSQTDCEQRIVINFNYF